MSDFWARRPDSFWETEPATLRAADPQRAAPESGTAAHDPFTPAPPPGAWQHRDDTGRAQAAAPVYPGADDATGAWTAPGSRLPPPSEPPARVGSAVAALVCALLTLLFPLLFLVLGFPVLTLLVNVPAIAFGVVALTRLKTPMEVERYIRYTWACILVYLALMAVILAAAIMVVLSFY